MFHLFHLLDSGKDDNEQILRSGDEIMNHLMSSKCNSLNRFSKLTDFYTPTTPFTEKKDVIYHFSKAIISSAKLSDNFEQKQNLDSKIMYADL